MKKHKQLIKALEGLQAYNPGMTFLNECKTIFAPDMEPANSGKYIKLDDIAKEIKKIECKKSNSKYDYLIFSDVLSTLSVSVDYVIHAFIIKTLWGQPTVKIGTSYGKEDIMRERYIIEYNDMYTHNVNNKRSLGTIWIDVEGGAVEIAISKSKS